MGKLEEAEEAIQARFQELGDNDNAADELRALRAPIPPVPA